MNATRPYCGGWWLLVVAAACCAIGCAGGPRVGGDWDQAVGTEWSLVSLDGRRPIEGTRITLTLAGDGRAVGHAGANRYFGTYEHDADGTLRFGALGATRMHRADPAGVMEQEADYLAALEAVRYYHVDDERLTLSDADRVRLRYRIDGP